MVHGGIPKDGLSKCKVDPCAVCNLSANANFVMYVQYGMLIHGICAGVKKMTPKFLRNLSCRKCERSVKGECVSKCERPQFSTLLLFLITVGDGRYL